MEIIGVLFIFVMPLLAGYVVNIITRQKETSQIETYLIGFFLLFFLQGPLFFLSIKQNLGFAQACQRVKIVLVVVAFLGVAVAAFRVFGAIKSRKEKNKEQDETLFVTKHGKEEKIYFVCMLFVFVIALVQIFAALPYTREDVVLETVRTTLSTDTMYQVHPLTGKNMELGMITSKQLVTLPLYYAFLADLAGLEAKVLLYVVISAFVLIASYFAVIKFAMAYFGKNRKAISLFMLIYGVMVISGTYFEYAGGYRLLYNGYAGEVICLLVMMPYVMYLLVTFKEKKQIWQNLVKIGICLMASLFMTGMGTGVLFILATLVIGGICCIPAKRKGAK